MISTDLLTVVFLRIFYLISVMVLLLLCLCHEHLPCFSLSIVIYFVSKTKFCRSSSTRQTLSLLCSFLSK